MKLYHATPVKNLASIQAEGLQAGKSLTSCREIWLHTYSRIEWAALHTAVRHHAAIEEIVILEVCVSRATLQRRRRGIYSRKKNILNTTFFASAEDLTK